MGMPWIPGYKPAKNYQKKIIAAIEHYLAKNPAAQTYRYPSHFPTKSLWTRPPFQRTALRCPQHSGGLSANSIP